MRGSVFATCRQKGGSPASSKLPWTRARARGEITKVLRVARLVLHAGKLDWLLLQKKVTSSKAKSFAKKPLGATDRADEHGVRLTVNPD